MKIAVLTSSVGASLPAEVNVKYDSADYFALDKACPRAGPWHWGWHAISFSGGPLRNAAMCGRVLASTGLALNRAYKDPPCPDDPGLRVV